MTGTNSNSQKAFTLVEVIVAIAVFLLIIGVALAIFISIAKNQRRILYEQEFFNQISYAKEHMSKALRMATADEDEINHCLVDEEDSYPGQNYLLTKRPGDLEYTGIKFLNASDVQVGSPVCTEFYLDRLTGILKEKKLEYPYIPLDDSYSLPLTSDKIFINSIKFRLDGCTESCLKTDSENIQPRVTFIINANYKGLDVPDKLFQTTISQRNLNAQ